MSLRDVVKISRKTFFNPSAWIDLSSLQIMQRTIIDVVKNLFQVQMPERTETFEEAMQRLNLNEDQVKFGATNFRIFALIFLLLGLLVFFYTFYVLFKYKAYFGWLLGMATSALLFSQAFKYDFWSLQMRQRRLGITGKEWLDYVLGVKETKQ